MGERDAVISLRDIVPVVNSIVVPVLVGIITMIANKNYSLKLKNREDMKKLKKEENRQARARGKVLMYMSRQELLTRIGHALERGYTTQREYDELSELYDAYISLGGNSTAKHLWEDRYVKLEIRNEEV